MSSVQTFHALVSMIVINTTDAYACSFDVLQNIPILAVYSIAAFFTSGSIQNHPNMPLELRIEDPQNTEYCRR